VGARRPKELESIARAPPTIGDKLGLFDVVRLGAGCSGSSPTARDKLGLFDGVRLGVTTAGELSLILVGFWLGDSVIARTSSKDADKGSAALEHGNDFLAALHFLPFLVLLRKLDFLHFLPDFDLFGFSGRLSKI
jgi:hypothetical protein